MIQVESFKRPSPSPSRSSVRSDSRMFRQPRVIQVNRDAAIMVDGETSTSGDMATTAQKQEFDSRFGQQSRHFRSRTFSDGFIRNTSLELLLGVDCDACLALAAERQCLNDHISKQDFDLVCNCNIQQNNYMNYHRDIGDHRGHTLNIYDLERIKRDTGRNIGTTSNHRSLDRKYTKNKSAGVSNYISKQFISYDPRNNLVQKIKRKLSNLKKMGGDAISKKNQNTVQLSEITSGSSSSLKKLSMLSIADKSQRKMNSQSCIFTATRFQVKDENKNRDSTYANFSSNVDQCFDRLRDYNVGTDLNKRTTTKMVKMRSFENSDNLMNRNSPLLESMKFSTLDNRSQCRGIRRHLSYNDFQSERKREKFAENCSRNDNTVEVRNVRSDLIDDEVQTFIDTDIMMLNDQRSMHARCTCESNQETRIPSIFYDSHVSIQSRYFLSFRRNNVLNCYR